MPAWLQSQEQACDSCIFKGHCLICVENPISREEKERERQVLHLLAHSPDGRNSLCWARRKPGASFMSPKWMARPQTLESFSTAFPGPLAGSVIGSGAAGKESYRGMTMQQGPAFLDIPQHWAQMGPLSKSRILL